MKQSEYNDLNSQLDKYLTFGVWLVLTFALLCFRPDNRGTRMPEFVLPDPRLVRIKPARENPFDSEADVQVSAKKGRKN